MRKITATHPSKVTSTRKNVRTIFNKIIDYLGNVGKYGVSTGTHSYRIMQANLINSFTDMLWELRLSLPGLLGLKKLLEPLPSSPKEF